MFRFRGRTTFEGKYVIGFLGGDRITDDLYIEDPGEFVERIHPHTLSISTGKPDSKGEEIFASFPIDGTMTEGGDVVSDRVSGVVSDVLFIDCAFRLLSKDRLHIDLIENYHFTSLTIIGKQGGGNDRRLNIMAQIGMERTDLHT